MLPSFLVVRLLICACWVHYRPTRGGHCVEKTTHWHLAGFFNKRRRGLFFGVERVGRHRKTIYLRHQKVSLSAELLVHLLT